MIYNLLSTLPALSSFLCASVSLTSSLPSGMLLFTTEKEEIKNVCCSLFWKFAQVIAWCLLFKSQILRGLPWPPYYALPSILLCLAFLTFLSNTILMWSLIAYFLICLFSLLSSGIEVQGCEHYLFCGPTCLQGLGALGGHQIHGIKLTMS